MKRTVNLIIFSLLLILAACSDQDEAEEATSVPTVTPIPPEATPLPTAVAPDTTTEGGWVATFAYAFPDGFWIAGMHSYGFRLECLHLDSDFSTDWLVFESTHEAESLAFPVYLRLNGLSIESFAPAYMGQQIIHPDQRTAATFHLVGLSQEDAEKAGEECTALVAWDNSAPAVMEVVNVFKQ